MYDYEKLGKPFNNSNINELLNIYKKIESLKDGYWKNLKLQEVKNIIYMCLGLNFQLNSPFIIGTPESKEFFNLKIVNPSKTKVLFKKININNIDFDINSILFNNNLFEKKLDIITDNSISSPYWLKENINIEFKETPTLKSTLRSKKKTTKQTVQSQQKPL